MVKYWAFPNFSCLLRGILRFLFTLGKINNLKTSCFFLMQDIFWRFCSAVLRRNLYRQPNALSTNPNEMDETHIKAFLKHASWKHGVSPWCLDNMTSTWRLDMASRQQKCRQQTWRLDNRNTPVDNMASPAQLLMSRRQGRQEPERTPDHNLRRYPLRYF